MKITTTTGVTEVKGIQIEKPIRALGFKISGEVGTIQVSLKLVGNSRGTSEVLLNRMNLSDLLEVNAAFGGVFQRGFAGMNPAYSLGIVDITNGGVIKFDVAGQYLELSLHNLTAADTTEVFGIEGELFDDILDAVGNPVNRRGRPIKYNQFSVNAATMVGQVTVQPAHELLVLDKVSGALESVKFNFLNGTSAEYTPEELDIRMMEENEIMSIQPNINAATVTAGLQVQEIFAGAQYVWTLEIPDTVKTIEVFTNGTAYPYYLTEIL